LKDAPITEFVVTDTIPISKEKHISQLVQLSIAPLIGEAISRIHTGRSVGELFQMDEEEDGGDPKAPSAMVGAKRG